MAEKLILCLSRFCIFNAVTDVGLGECRAKNLAKINYAKNLK